MTMMTHTRRRSALAAALLAMGLPLSSCQTVQTTKPGIVGVERQQTMLLSAGQVDRSAALAYEQEMQAAKKKGLLNQNPAQVARVRGIVARLVAGTSVFRADARDWPWEINVISSNAVNAWCMPGGRMAVYTGLIDRLKLTDDELAAVLGHEMAHALREHGRERASQAAAQSVALSVIGAAAGVGGASLELAQVIGDLTFNLPNSREHEREADRIGVELAARAGYDPRAAVTLWQKMAQAGGAGMPQFLSTHPAPENRTRDLQQYAERVMPYYEAARKR
jgi:predicted Zn-dependent protease